MKALVVAFYYDGSSKSERYRLLFDFFLVQARRWAHLFDRLCLVDSGWRLTERDEARLRQRFRSVHIMRRRPLPHWDNVRYALDTAAADVEMVALVDSDTVIYDPDPLAGGLDRIAAGQCDVVAITDGSGGYRTAAEFDRFAANRQRAERRRLAPYLCLARRPFLDGLSFDPLCVTRHGDNWTDSFGAATLEVMRRGARLEELEDDRNTLYLHEDGTTARSTNLDGPPYLWSTPVDRSKATGYYHIRNFGASIRWINNFHTHRKTFDFEAQSTPRTEMLRLLGWCWTLAAACRPVGDPLFPDIARVVTHLGVSPAAWLNYTEEWLDYHPWLKTF